MIRSLWIVALTGVLCLVLYVPSAFTEEQLLQTVHAEHELNARLWGDAAASEILQRTAAWQAAVGAVSTPPPATVQIRATGVDSRIGESFAQMSTRLFSAPYFRSVDALFTLATYRAAAVLQILPLLLAFMAVCFLDGLVVRRVRARELVRHSAELFTVSAVTGIALLALTLVVFFLPSPLHPMYAIGALLLMLYALSRAVANYHILV